MAITVYTYNDKVLKNVATDKWLKKADAPAGFVMNASNATITYSSGSYYASWESPTYPDNYDGNGKHYSIVNNNDGTTDYGMNTGLMYASSTTSGGPTAIPVADIRNIGTTTGSVTANVAAYGYGKYLTLPFTGNYTEEQIRAYVANLTITILD